ncbi:unnamed protein product [Closterium sp. Yama58-4]|nr:unnamed protein product [Closterium sp. Yama58-4]
MEEIEKSLGIGGSNPKEKQSSARTESDGEKNVTGNSGSRGDGKAEDLKSHGEDAKEEEVEEKETVQMLADGDADGIPILIGVKEPKKESKSKKAEEESKKVEGGKDDKEKEKGKDKGEDKRDEKRKSGAKEGDVGAGTGDGKAGKESASAADDNPDQYEGEEGDGAQNKAKGGGKKGGKGENVGEMMEKILERLDDMEGEGGKFNETLEKQEAVLETVARVGKHHVHEKEEKEREEREKAEQEEAEREAELKAKQEAEAAAAAAKNSWDGGVTGGGERSFFDILLGIDAAPPPPPPPRPTPKNVTKASAKNETKKEQESEQEDEKDVPRLIDSQDNEYVISSPGKGSKMQLQEDFTLISDIVKVIVAAALGGLACGLMGQPIILGYIVAGMAIGPGGLGLIHELVQVGRVTTWVLQGVVLLGGLACGLMGQPIILGYFVAGMAIGPGGLGLIHELVQSKVETLAQFGVVFLLFALGVEFSLAKMQGVHNVALGGGVLQILIAMILGGIFSSNTPQGLFIGGFLSMSSTAVVLKCLVDINGFNSEHGQIMLGTLIAQDCALGLLLAIMPALAARPASASAILLALVRELLILLAFCLVAWALSRLLVPRFLRLLVRVSRGNNELYQLGIMGNCLCVALLSEYLGLSLEVGAFIAGLMLSAPTASAHDIKGARRQLIPSSFPHAHGHGDAREWRPFSHLLVHPASLPHSQAAWSERECIAADATGVWGEQKVQEQQVQPMHNMWAALFPSPCNATILHPLNPHFLYPHPFQVAPTASEHYTKLSQCATCLLRSSWHGIHGHGHARTLRPSIPLCPCNNPPGGTYSERTLHQVEPVRNMFAALFLASIGMVMHPMFLWQHKDILLLALAVVFLGKTLLVALVVRGFGYSAGTAAAVGIALAQIGEFSFVLLSRAQTLKLVGHKLYLLLMGTTALSLVLTPFAFKLVPRLAAIGAHQDLAIKPSVLAHSAQLLPQTLFEETAPLPSAFFRHIQCCRFEVDSAHRARGPVGEPVVDAADVESMLAGQQIAKQLTLVKVTQTHSALPARYIPSLFLTPGITLRSQRLFLWRF